MDPEYKCLGMTNHFSKVFLSCFQTEFVGLSKKEVAVSQFLQFILGLLMVMIFSFF
jgi:hypothetical protein